MALHQDSKVCTSSALELRLQGDPHMHTAAGRGKPPTPNFGAIVMFYPGMQYTLLPSSIAVTIKK